MRETRMDGCGCLMALILALLSVQITTIGTEVANINESNCKISEFQCQNGTCISSSKYCDGKYDCIDKSDEPLSCSACNRTLYGETGKTYEIEIHNRKITFPFVCHLNFTAPGSIFGDIIQLNFIKFTVGRFESYSTHDECLDGYMLISEQGLPKLNGKWCGTAEGYTIYYSETRSVNLSLRLEKNVQLSGIDGSNSISTSNNENNKKIGVTSVENAIVESRTGSNNGGVGHNFEFKLMYKFLKIKDAKLRYDGNVWTGDLIPGSYCNRNLYDCDKSVCRIRSPNYPGIYPRNLTCKYHIHQRLPPAGLHAMIVLRQPEGHKLHIKDQTKHFEQNNRKLRSWERCDSTQDLISVRDGKSEDFPEIARLCGGDALPDIVSSGPDMFVEFHSSEHDSPFHPMPVSFLPGFELQVLILYVSSNSQSYVRHSGKCEFTIGAFESQTGELETPQHTLPPETVCLYHFQGRRHETVWISFIKYHPTVDPAAFEPPTECVTQLRIWDGRWTANSRLHVASTLETQRNASLIESICREEVPRLCSRSLVTKGSRPCTTQESYLSTGPDLTIEYIPSPIGSAQLYGPGSAFKLRYEFVDNSLGGAPLEPLPAPSAMPEPAALVQFQTTSCDRVYRSTASTRGIFRSPSNIFLYGRGGSANVTCTIRFEASAGENVRLTITRARFGGRTCQNIQNRSGRWHCNYHGGAISDLRISEVPWPDISPLPRDCMCSDISSPVTLSPLAASIVEVRFTAFEMGVDQDFRDFYFEGRYDFTSDGCEIDWNERRLRGHSGEAYLRELLCAPLIQPWLLQPETEGAYLVLKLKGFWMPTMLQSAAPCPIDARITVYPADNPQNSKDLCPSGPEVVAFSDGWDSAYKFSAVEVSKNLVIEFRSPKQPSIETFEYKFSWMEVYPAQDCPHQCSELQACIPADLWCDGIKHCPSGEDESPLECNVKLPLSPLHVGVAAATLTLFLSLAAGLAACARRKKNEKKYLQSHTHIDTNVRYPTHSLSQSHGGVDINGRYPTHHMPPLPHTIPPLYLDTSAKDSFC